MPIGSGQGSADPASQPRPTSRADPASQPRPTSRASPASQPRPTSRASPASQPRPTSRPRLAAHVRLTFDPSRERHVLLTPEAVTVLNGTGAAILGLCDGRRTVAEIVTELRGRYDHVDDEEVRLFLVRLAERRCLEVSCG